MTTVVAMPIAQDATLSNKQRVQIQRDVARQALAECAKRYGAPVDGWQQDANRVPLPNAGHCWSISHKPHWAGAAISQQPVGVDVEHFKPRRNRDLWKRLAQRDEWRVAGQESWEMFFRLWTAKEATLKANGKGIGDLSLCIVTAMPDARHTILTYRDREWTVQHHYHAEHIFAVTASEAVQWHIVQ